MPITLNDNAAVHSPKPIDSRYMNFLSGSSVPWASAAAAVAGIPSAYRYPYLTVLALAANNDVLEYWWQIDLTDASLVPKNKESFTLNADGPITLTGPYFFGEIIVLPTSTLSNLIIGTTSEGNDIEPGAAVSGGAAYTGPIIGYIPSSVSQSIYFGNIATGTKILVYKRF